MTPYYEDDHATIYHADCLEIIGELEFDAVVTDPPYGFKHYETDVDVTAAALGGLDRPMMVFGYPEIMVAWCVALGWKPTEWVTWWPTNGAMRGTNFHGLWKESECVAVFGKHEFADSRQAKESKSANLLRSLPSRANSKNSRGNSNGNPTDRHLSDVWRDAAPGLGFNSHERLHPNEKPVSVLNKLIQGCVAGTVLDPFMGSGTTLRAAKDLGRKSIGIELEERYCEIAANRLAQEVLDFG